LGIRSSHGKRIRRAEADSSGAPAQEDAPREITHPERERGSGDRDDPRPAALEARGNCNEPQTERQHPEQETEKPPLHAFSVIATLTGATDAAAHWP
jgi:hypothetical protein